MMDVIDDELTEKLVVVTITMDGDTITIPFSKFAMEIDKEESTGYLDLRIRGDFDAAYLWEGEE